jgi:hypothetical protein
MERDEPHKASKDNQTSVGLWKLLVAATLILIALIAAMEVFKDRPSERAMPKTPAQATAP